MKGVTELEKQDTEQVITILLIDTLSTSLLSRRVNYILYPSVLEPVWGWTYNLSIWL